MGKDNKLRTDIGCREEIGSFSYKGIKAKSHRPDCEQLSLMSSHISYY